MSVLIFLGVLFILVLVHELGHFAVAKWTGMRVDEFGIGFPPRLFGYKKGETLYSFNALPIGGFVKIYGEDSLDESAMLHSDAKLKSFTSKNKWAQSAVLLAGITMNILFAWLLVFMAFMGGVESAVSEAEAGPTARLSITSVLPGSPADKASLAGGAVIKSVDAQGETLSTLTPSSFSGFVESHKGEPLTVVYTYKGEPRMVQLTPEQNVLAENPSQYAIGVALTQVDTIHRSFGEAVTDSFVYIISSLRDITLGIGKLVYDAVLFKADFSQVAGPVGIVGLVGEASAFGLTTLLIFTAFISLNLAVINVLPFPALDGGRLLFVIIEAIKGSPIKAQYVAVLNTVGFFLLILLMVAVTWNDISKII